MPEQIAIWIPNDLNPASQTSAIANYMLANNQNVIPIDVNTAYHNNFKTYYDQHIKQNELAHATFCSKNGQGINVDYLTDYANKHTYATLLSLDIDFSRLPIKRVWLKAFCKQLNYIKIPFPALMYSNHKWSGYGLYF